MRKIKQVSKTEFIEEIESAGFVLSLPDIITQKAQPQWRVPVSKNLIALIYYNTDADDPNQKDYYSMVLVNAKTGVRSKNHYRYETYHKLWELKHALTDISASLNVKKRKRTESEEFDEDDE